jgi:hypothetical protein
LNQRWRDRRAAFRPAGEPIDTRRYEVAAIPGDAGAKAFVLQHHYAGTYPAARFRFGLYRRAELVGVAVFSHPCNDAVLTNVFPVPATDAVELGRFVLLDDVPGNGETWFLARAFDLLRGEVAGVLSFSDPVPRAALDGRLVFPGHVGTIYQAHNGVFMGRGRCQVLRLLPDGSVFSQRARQKIRARDKGWRYAAALLERAGAAPLGEGEDARAWADRWVPALTRPLRHPGNYKYAWPLDRHLRRHLGRSQPYPKRDAPGQLPLAGLAA